jgi:DNA-binding Lrp family transcriptional regulator
MTSAFLFINAGVLFVEDIIDKLKEVPEIVDIYKVQGIYDIITRVNSDTEEKLKELVSECIRRIDRITGTNSYYGQRDRGKKAVVVENCWRNICGSMYLL